MAGVCWSGWRARALESSAVIVLLMGLISEQITALTCRRDASAAASRCESGVCACYEARNDQAMSRRVAGNAAWNVGGQLVSLGVGLLALPMLLHELGAARLGVFTLALGLIGFSGLFDLGLGRALTQTVSSALGQGRSSAHVAALVWRVITLLIWFGVFWLAALWLAAPFIVDRVFSLTGSMASETVFGLRMLALSTPFVLAAVGAMGALEGLQQFRLLSLWRMPMSVLQFGLPVAVAFVVPDVGWVIAALAVTRVAWMALWLSHLRHLLPRVAGVAPSREDLRHALHFGGWLSVSNLIGPLMVYADRFYLASVFPPATVAYYTVPFDTAFRATSLPQMAMNAMFPAFAHAQSRPGESVRLLEPTIRVVAMLALPAVLVVAVLAQPLLALWLDAEFAASAAGVLKLLSLGIFFNSLAHLPYALLQAHGRSDLTAKLHLLELPLFVLLLVVGVHAWGIVGAALAWTLRVGLDACLLYASAWWLQHAHRVALARAMAGLLLATSVFLLVVYVVKGPPQLVSVALVAVICAVALSRDMYLAMRATREKRAW